MRFSTLHSLLGGDRLVVIEKFDAARIVDVIERYRVTTFTATPTMLQRIADLPDVDARDLSSIEWILQGAAPMPPSLVHRWVDLIGARKIIMAYGMTESNRHRRAQRRGVAAARGKRRAWDPGTEVRILGEDGNDLPPGETGEIFLRRRRTAGPTTWARRRSCGPPKTASRPSATWATSTRTATSTWSTAAWT